MQPGCNHRQLAYLKAVVLMSNVIAWPDETTISSYKDI